MRKIIAIIIISIFLTACSSLSTIMEAAYTGVPTWAIQKPTKKGLIYFVSSSNAENQNQRANLIYRDLLAQISEELGYEVTGTYYRELSTLGTIAELGLEIIDYSEISGTLYYLAVADEALFDSKRSEEYKLELDRARRITALKEEAIEYYKNNNDIDTLNCYVSAALILNEGPALSYTKEEFLDSATEIAKNIKFKLSDVDPNSGKCILNVSRDRGALSPRVVEAPILVTIMVHDHSGSYFEYSYREITDEKGQVEFFKKFPRMANIGSVTFSLDIATEALPSEALKKEIEETTITFDYNIVSEVAKDGIVIAFSEWDENGEQLPTTYSSDAFRSYLEKDGIKVVNAIINGNEFEEVLASAQERFADKRYLIWSRVGRNTIHKTFTGDYVTSSQGYTVLADLKSGEMLYYDYDTQSVAWGPDWEKVNQELFTSYGILMASQITRYL